MNNATRIVRLIAGFMLIGVPTVTAQTPPPTKNIYVDVNFGVQPASQTFSITTPNPPQIVYGESVILSGTQGINGSTLIDIMGGYRVWRNFSVALGFDTVVQLLADHGASVVVKNRRGITPLQAAAFGSTTGRGRAAPAGADSLGFERPVELAHPTTVALLKKLGASE